MRRYEPQNAKIRRLLIPAGGKRLAPDSDFLPPASRVVLRGGGTETRAQLLDRLALSGAARAEQVVRQLQMSCGNRCVQRALRLDRQRGGEAVANAGERLWKKGEGDEKGKFKPMESKEAEAEFEKRKAQYRKEGKDEREAGFLAMDDMFAGRIEATGGRRFPKTATRGKAGEKTYVLAQGQLFNAAIDAESYNCHSYTFADGKDNKSAKLKGLAKTIPMGEAKGEKYFEAGDLARNDIYVDLGPPTLIFPRWVAFPREVERFLADYRPRKAGEKLSAAKGDVAVYSTDGDYPHSARVVGVDGKGNPEKVKGKFGHFSLFEHEPGAVPAHYGKPFFYRRK